MSSFPGFAGNVFLFLPTTTRISREFVQLNECTNSLKHIVFQKKCNVQCAIKVSLYQILCQERR